MIALKDSWPAYHYNRWAYRIPDLYLDGQIIDNRIPRPKLDSKSRLVILLESILGKAKQHA